MNRLVVLTDLGTFKAFTCSDDQVSRSPQLRPVDATRMEEGDHRIGRQVTDEAGRFQKGSPMAYAAHDQSNGERHNICLENDRRSVKQIAERMSELLSDQAIDSCYFAASSDINKSILDELPREARAKIEKNIECNLVNAPREEILEHFHN